MRIVIDTNVLVSALLIDTSLPARLIQLWRAGIFDVLSSAEQIEELKRVSRYPKIRQRLSPALAGRLVNQLRDLAVIVTPLPEVTASPDPYDNFLRATAQAGRANFLVTGDKSGLLNLLIFGGTPILSVRTSLAAHLQLP